MRVAITGSSGCVGRALRASLEADGHVVHPVVRRSPRDGEIRWDIAAGELDGAALEGVDAVVHLAAESIGQRWTAAARERIVRSRVDGTRLVARTLAGLSDKPAVLVSASAVGIYGDTGDTVVDEHSPAGSNFLADTATAWEAELGPAEDAGIRVVRLRSGIVQSSAEGMLAELLPIARMGLLGPAGSGRQWVAWIALGDLVRAYRTCIEGDFVGPVIGCAPEPVTQRDYAALLGKALRRPAFIPAPGFAMKLLMGQMAVELVLEGQRCDPRVLRESGFEWEHPTLESCLRAELGR